MIENKKFCENLKRAEAGDALAMYFVATSYYDGTAPGDPFSHERLAIEWYERCVSASNYPPALKKLAACYRNQSGNERQAYEMTLRAAEAGDAESMFYVGEYYTDNEGEGLFESVLPELRDKAIAYYKRSAALGCINAVSSLRRMGVDIPEAPIVRHSHKEIFEDAERGLMHYEFEAGHLYLRDDLDYNNPALAFAYISRAAEQGLAVAHYFMGFCYLNGIGVEKDLAEAEKWFESSLSGELIRPESVNKKAALENIEKIRKKRKA